MIAEVDGEIVYLTGRQKPGPFSSLSEWQRHLALIEKLQPRTPAVAAAITEAERHVSRLKSLSSAPSTPT